MMFLDVRGPVLIEYRVHQIGCSIGSKGTSGQIIDFQKLPFRQWKYWDTSVPPR